MKKTNLTLLLTAAMSGMFCACQPKDNTLTKAEQEEGWELLFNGQDLSEWRNYNDTVLSNGWAAVDGCIQASGEGGDASEYGIGLSYTGGTNFYDNGIATINGVENCPVLKIGTSKNPGDFTLTVPAGKHSFYAVTWAGTGTADVVLKDGETVIKTVTVKENTGATQNSPYTLTVTDADKYEFEVSAACTLTVTSEKRVIFFGIK